MNPNATTYSAYYGKKKIISDLQGAKFFNALNSHIKSQKSCERMDYTVISKPRKIAKERGARRRSLSVEISRSGLKLRPKQKINQVSR
jgi:hypothetical protein